MASVTITASVTKSNARTTTGTGGSLQTTSGYAFDAPSDSPLDVSSYTHLRLWATALAAANSDEQPGSPFAGLRVELDTGPTATGPWTPIASESLETSQRVRVLAAPIDNFVRARWSRSTRDLPSVTIALTGEALP